jgi:branched-chain amino acid transport system substrate-binding protein
MGRVKDFLPYAAKIKASCAQAVITGNWGNDLSFLVKAAKDVGYEGKFYTFYGNALGAPAAMSDAGVGKVLAVAEWMPNVPGAESAMFYQSFKQRFAKPSEDYLHLRMQLMVEALAQSIEKAGQTEPLAVALQLENAEVSMAGQRGKMRAMDHQFQQPMVVAMMAKQGGPDVPFDVEGSGYGFKVIRQFKAQELELPSVCKMNRPHS